MTVTAEVTAPVKTAGAQPPKPKAAAPPRPKPVALTPMRRQAAKSMRSLAAHVQQSHPDMTVHDHLRDAARTLESGNEEASQRHLRAAMFALTPQSLMRNGLHTDDAHQSAREAMHGVHRHLLLVKDIADADAKNQAAIRRDSGDGAAVPPPRPDPNAGYGPGANAQKPTVRQPPGGQALNAPAASDGGGSDPSTADPGGPQAKGPKQLAARYEAGAVLDLVGPGGFQHGWKPGGPTAADHDKAAKLHTQAAAKAKDPAVKAMHVRRAKVHAQVAKKLRSLSPVPAAAGLAYGWGDLSAFIDLSAKTAALESTPALYGKPGGPGLYGVAGNKHSDYFEQVVKGLMTKRGMDKGQASAIAWGVLRKWAHGGGGVHPEVAAAASKALAQESAASAKAHNHAGSWDDVLRVLDFGLVPGEPRVPAGSATAGQFSAGGAAAPASQQAAAKGKQPPPQTAKQKAAAAAAAKAKAASDAHKAHVAHVAHALKVSTGKAGLLVSADDDRKQAAGLIAKRNTLAKELASASGKTSTGQSGSTTSANSTTSTTAPAAAATTASTAPASTSTTASAAKTATAAASTATSATSAAGLKTQITALNTQINQLLTAAATATAQASKMK
jgi:hypothetical protein